MTQQAIQEANVGEKIIHNRYELDDLPREGGFAYVYRAFDTKILRNVALKRLKPERTGDTKWLEHFRNEGRLLASIPPHPNVVQVFDVDSDPLNGIDYFTMEWVEGQSLNEWRLRQPVHDMTLLLNIAIGICRGLEAIHEANLVHGDITMGNILLANQPGQITPKLTDFGLSWNADDDHPNLLGGTRRYLAPEQLNGSRWNHRADIYSLGAVLFFLFSGEHYLSSVQSAENQDLSFELLKNAICNELPRTLQSVLGTANSNLNELLLRLLEKEPEDRPQTIAEVRSYLQEIETEYQKRNQRSLHLLSATKSELIPQQDLPSEVKLGLYFPQAALQAAYDRLNDVLSQYKSIPERVWQDSGQLTWQIFEQGKDYDFYIYNNGDGRNPGELSCRLVLAVDTGNEANAKLCEKLIDLQDDARREKTLVIECIRRPDRPRLLVRNISLKSIETGTRNIATIALRVQFDESVPYSGLPTNLLAEIKKLPTNIEPDPEVRKRLEHWKAYLNVWEKLVRQKTYEVEYSSWRPDQGQTGEISRVWFYLRNDVEAIWEKIHSSRSNPIHLRESEEQPENFDEWKWEDEEPVYIEMGFIKRVSDRDNRYAILVELDEKILARYIDQSGALDIPRQGYLAYKAVGDLIQIKNQRRAFEDLETGKAANPRLGQFIFDAGQAVYPEHERVVLRSDEFLLQTLNDNQRVAVEGALTAPDMYLIWGPPGTGKTTVIAELCYQFARRGERVLIASQANLAVDNALSKLVHHPSIVALRVGKEGRIEEEGQPFTEKQVVSTWFERTAKDAEQRLLRIDEYIDRFAAFVEADYVRLEHYLKEVGKYQEEIPQLQAAHNQAAARLTEGRESYQTQIQRRDAVEDVLSLVKDSREYVKIGRLPDTELWRRWRSIVVDLIANPVYQDYLANLATALNSVEETQPTLSNEIINRILKRDDRAMLRGIQEGRQEAGLNRHRVTAVLFLGEHLRDVVSQQEIELRPLEIKLRTLREKFLEHQQIDSRLRLIEDFTQSRQLLQLVYDLHPTIRELLQTYQLYLAENEQIQFQSSALHELENKISTVGNKIEVLQRKIDLQSHVANLQTQLREHLEALTEEAPHLQQAKERVTSLSQQVQGRSLIVRQIEMSVLEQEQIVHECRAALTSLDSLLPWITAWLHSPQSAPATDLPEVIVEVLTQEREELTIPAVNPLIEVLERIRSVVRKAVTQYLSVIPSTYHRTSVDPYLAKSMLAKSMRQQLSALFVKQKTATTDVWLPQNRATVIQDVEQILEGYVSKAVKLKNSPPHGQKDWSIVTSEFDLVKGFGVFINKQIEIQKSQKNIGRSSDVSGELDHQRVKHVIKTVILREEEKLRQRKLDVQTAEHEAQAVHARYQPAQELLRQFVASALGHLNVMQPVCAEIDSLLDDVFFREPLALIVEADEKTDFASIAAQIEVANRSLTDFFRSCADKLAGERTDYSRLHEQQKALELSIAEHEQAVLDLLVRIKPPIATVTAIQEKLSAWNSAEHISTLSDVVSSLLVDIDRRASVNQDEIVAVNTETLSHQENLVRGLLTKLREATRKSKLAAADIGFYANQWRTDQVKCQTDITEDINIALRQVEELGFDTHSLKSEIDEKNLHNWEQLHRRVERTIKKGPELAISLDTTRLLDLFGVAVRQAETDIHQQISDLIVANERAEKDVERTTDDLNRYQHRFNDEHDWWEEVFAAIPRRLRESLGNPVDIHTSHFIREVLDHLESSDWKSEVKRQEALLKPAKAMLLDWTQRLKERTPRDIASLKELYVENANVVGVTCGQVNRVYSLMRKRRDLRPFDAVIIDEVSKATPPELLMPMLKGKKIILVGDHKQLPPMIEAKTVDEIAEEQGISSSDVSHLKRSLFESLYNFAPQVLKGMLTEQYRMRQPIMYAINQFYGDMLTGGHDREHGLALPKIDPATSIVWINTPRDENFFEKKEGFTYSNPSEIEIIERLLQQMNKAWLPHYIEGNPTSRKEVGLITFYMAQLAEFRDRILNKDRYPALNLRIGTVDRFQGMERQVVIVSLVRNNPQGTIGFAREPERINVAFSRAQELLVIVGCKSLFTQQARKAGDATESYSKVAYVVEHEGRTVDVSEFQQNR
jgi:serine/threonine protein kinase/RecA/RadA recombinase